MQDLLVRVAGPSGDPLALSVLGAWGLTVAPHVLKLGLAFTKQGLDYNNVTPRETQWSKVFPDDTSDLVKRCTAAHLNGHENLPVYGLAVVLCKLNKVPNEKALPLAAAYLTARAAYNVAYALGYNLPLSYVRTATFFASVGALVQLYALAIWP